MQELFYKEVEKIFSKIKNTQSSVISDAADKLSDIIGNGGIIYAFGSGHSHMLAEEISARAGGLIQAKGILEPELILDLGRGKSTLIERMPGYADIILDTNKIRSKDALIIISNSGRNSVPVQLAAGAKKKGIFVIALTNLEHSKSVTSRDPSGKKLYEEADLVLDTCGVVGDASVKVPGKPYSISPTSTIAGAIIVEALVSEIVGRTIEKGKEPYVLQSANVDGNDNYNEEKRKELIGIYPELECLLD